MTGPDESTGRAFRGVGGRVRDQEVRSAPVEVVPRPLDHHEKPVFKFEKCEDMDERPGQPRAKAIHFQPAEFSHGGVAADRRQASAVPVSEGRDEFPLKPALDDLCDILPSCMAAGATPGTT